MKTKKLDYVSAVRYPVLAVLFYLLSFALQKRSVLGLALSQSVCYLGLNPIAVSAFFLAVYVINFEKNLFISALISSVVTAVSFYAFKTKGKRPSIEAVFLTPLSLAPYVLLSEDKIYSSIAVAITTLFTFLFVSSSRALFIKKFDYKISNEEKICLSLFAISVGLGILRVSNVYVYKAICLFLILFGGRLYSVKSIPLAVVLSLPLAVFTKDLNFTACFTLLSLITSIISPHSDILGGLSACGIEALLIFLIPEYGTFAMPEILFEIIPIVIFIFIPSSALKKLTSKIDTLNDKYLTKYSVNRIKSTLSSRLYEVSEVFGEMQLGFKQIQDSVMEDKVIIAKIADELKRNVCEGCQKYSKCISRGNFIREELLKTVAVGIAKNRITLIDLTKSFSETCSYTNSVLYELNNLIGVYKEKIKEAEEVGEGRKLIRMQSEGVSQVLKNLALEMTKNVVYDSEKEKAILDKLLKEGITVNELSVSGEGEKMEINIVMPSENLNKKRFIPAISEAVGRLVNVTAKTSISIKICAVTVKPSPRFDAAFGLATKTKENSLFSGDTHALTKLSEGKFLISLSDGMGSGLKAKNTSSTAISLIEAFYKSGIESSLLLQIVNKTLSLSLQDNFSAMDICVVDLFNSTADFIKIGAPTSFILEESEVKIVEGNSLPLGILEEATPNGCTIPVKHGSSVILFTDGVSDAFGSSTDVLDFVRTLENKNPQLIADSILNKALDLSGEKARDDMTVLAVRIFEK